jgi:HK97 gp10 family phage protein
MARPNNAAAAARYDAVISARKAGKKAGGSAFFIEGMPELTAKLQQFEMKLQKRAMRLATKEAAQVVLHQARALAPIDSGNLAAGLKVRAKVKGRRGSKEVGSSVVTTAVNGTIGKKSYYAAAVEFGTENMEAQPFLRPAASKSRSRAEAIFKRRIIELVSEMESHGRILTAKERLAVDGE